MLIVKYFLSFVLVNFDIISKADMVERKIGFDFVFESGVEAIPSWSKTNDRSNIQ